MKESGVLSNIWSKYRLQKAEVSRIMVHLKTKDKFEIWNKSNNTDNKVVGLIISSRSELKRRKKKFSLTLQYFYWYWYQGCLGTGITALGLENLMGIFLFLSISIVLVLLIFLVEQLAK